MDVAFQRKREFIVTR